jgi:uncharacterized Zn finger protein (UPF0148 family)
MTAVTIKVEPAERLARAQRVQKLANGTVRIRLACAHCYGTNLYQDAPGEIRCVTCGRTTREKLAHTIRRQRISRYIRTGDL